MEQAKSSSGHEQGAEPAKLDAAACEGARAQLPRLALSDVRAALAALRPNRSAVQDPSSAGDDPLSAEAAAWFTAARLQRFADCFEKAPFLWRGDHLICKKTSIRGLAYKKLLESLGESTKGKHCVPRAMALCRVFSTRLKEQLQLAAEESHRRGKGPNVALKLCPPWARHANSYLQLMPEILSHLRPVTSAPLEVQIKITTASTAPCPYDFDTDSEQPETTKKQTRKHTKRRTKRQKNTKGVPAVRTAVDAGGDQETEIDIDLRNFATNIMGALTDACDNDFGSDQEAEINVQLRKNHITNVSSTPSVKDENLDIQSENASSSYSNSPKEYERITNVSTPPCVNDHSHNEHETIITNESTSPCVDDNNKNDYETIITNESTSPCVDDNNKNDYENLIADVNDDNTDNSQNNTTNISMPCLNHDGDNESEINVINELTRLCVRDGNSDKENETNITIVSTTSDIHDGTSDKASEASIADVSLTPSVGDETNHNESQLNVENATVAPYTNNSCNDNENEINVDSMLKTPCAHNNCDNEIEANIQNSVPIPSATNTNDKSDKVNEANIEHLLTMPCATNTNDKSDKENEVNVDSETTVQCDTNYNSNEENEACLEKDSMVTHAPNDNSINENKTEMENASSAACATNIITDKNIEPFIENVTVAPYDIINSDNEINVDTMLKTPCAHNNCDNEIEANIQNSVPIPSATNTNDKSDKVNEANIEHLLTMPCATNTNDKSDKENEVNVDSETTVQCDTNYNSNEENETCLEKDSMVTHAPNDNSINENKTEMENASSAACATNIITDKNIESFIENVTVAPYDIINSDNECAESPGGDPLDMDLNEDEPGSKKSVTQLCGALIRRWIELQDETKTRLRSHLRVHTATASEDTVVAVDVSDEERDYVKQSNSNDAMVDDPEQKLCDETSKNDDREFKAALNKLKTVLMMKETDHIDLGLLAKDVERDGEPVTLFQTIDNNDLFVQIDNDRNSTENCDDGKSNSIAKEKNIILGDKLDAVIEKDENLVQPSLIKETLSIDNVPEQETDFKHHKLKVDLIANKKNIYNTQKKTRMKSENVTEQEIDKVKKKKSTKPNNCNKRQKIHMKSNKMYKQEIGKDNPRKQSHANDRESKYNQIICSKKQKLRRCGMLHQNKCKHRVLNQEPSNKIRRKKRDDKKFKNAFELVIKNTAALHLSIGLSTDEQKLVQQNHAKDTVIGGKQCSNDNSIRLAVRERNFDTSRDDIEMEVVRARNYLFQRTHFRDMTVFDQERQNLSEYDDNGKFNSGMSNETINSKTKTNSRENSFDTTDDVKEGEVDVFITIPSPESNNLRHDEVLRAPCTEANMFGVDHVDENVIGLNSKTIGEHQDNDNIPNPPLKILRDNEVLSPKPNILKELEKVNVSDIVAMVDFDSDDANTGLEKSLSRVNKVTRTNASHKRKRRKYGVNTKPRKKKRKVSSQSDEYYFEMTDDAVEDPENSDCTHSKSINKRDHMKDDEEEKIDNSDKVDANTSHLSNFSDCSDNEATNKRDQMKGKTAKKNDNKDSVDVDMSRSSCNSAEAGLGESDVELTESNFDPKLLMQPVVVLRRFTVEIWDWKNYSPLRHKSRSPLPQTLPHKSKRERVTKKVKLPDIEEVRRKNRKMLTAQVTPITQQIGLVSAACEHVGSPNISTTSMASSLDSCSQCTAQRLSSSPDNTAVKPRRGAAARARSFITSYANGDLGLQQHKRKRRGHPLLPTVSSDDGISPVDVDIVPKNVPRTSPKPANVKKRRDPRPRSVSSNDESPVVDVVSTRELLTFEDELNTTSPSIELLVSIENKQETTSFNSGAHLKSPNDATSDQDGAQQTQELTQNDQDPLSLERVGVTHITPIPSDVAPPAVNKGLPTQIIVQKEDALEQATNFTASPPKTAPPNLNVVVPTNDLTRILMEKKKISAKSVKKDVMLHLKRKRLGRSRFTSPKDTSSILNEGEPDLTNFESAPSIVGPSDIPFVETLDLTMDPDDQDTINSLKAASSPDASCGLNEDVATQDLITIQNEQGNNTSVKSDVSLHSLKRKRQVRPRFRSPDDSSYVPDEPMENLITLEGKQSTTNMCARVFRSSFPEATSASDERVHIRDLIIFENNETRRLEPVRSNAAASTLIQREITKELTTIQSKQHTNTHSSSKRVKLVASLRSDADHVFDEGLLTRDATTTKNRKAQSSRSIVQPVSTASTGELTTQKGQPPTALKRISRIASVPSNPAPSLTDGNPTTDLMQTLVYSDDSNSYDDPIILSDDESQDFAIPQSEDSAIIINRPSIPNETTPKKSYLTIQDKQDSLTPNRPSIPKGTVLTTQDDIATILKNSAKQDCVVKALKGTVLATQDDVLKALKATVLATQEEVVKTTQDDIVKARQKLVLTTQNDVLKAVKGSVLTSQDDVIKTRKSPEMATLEHVIKIREDTVLATQDDVVQARKSSEMATLEYVLKVREDTVLAMQDDYVKARKDTVLTTKDDVVKALEERRTSTDCNRDPISSEVIKPQKRSKLGFKPLLYRQKPSVPSSSVLIEGVVDLAQDEEETRTDFSDRQNDAECSRTVEDDGNLIDNGIEKDQISTTVQPLTEENLAELSSDLNNSNAADIIEEFDNQTMDTPDEFSPVIVSVQSLAPHQELVNERNLETQSTVQPNLPISSKRAEPLSLTSCNVQQVVVDDPIKNPEVYTDLPNVVNAACVIRVPAAQTNPSKIQNVARVSGSKNKSPLPVITLKQVKRRRVCFAHATSPASSSPIDPQEGTHLPKIINVSRVISLPSHVQEKINVQTIRGKTPLKQPESLLEPPSPIPTSCNSQVMKAPLNFRKILPKVKVTRVSNIHLSDSEQTDPTNVDTLASKSTQPSNLPKITLTRAQPVYASYKNTGRSFLMSNSSIDEVQEVTNFPRVVDVTGDLHVMQPDDQMGLHLVVSQTEVASDVRFSNIHQPDKKMGGRYVVSNDDSLPNINQLNTDGTVMLSDDEIGLINIVVSQEVVSTSIHDSSPNINNQLDTDQTGIQDDNQIGLTLVVSQEEVTTSTDDSSPNTNQNDIEETVIQLNDQTRLNLVCQEEVAIDDHSYFSLPNINPNDVAVNSNNPSKTEKRDVMPRRISVRRRPSVPLLLRSVQARRDAKKVNIPGTKRVGEMSAINYKPWSVEDLLVSGCAAPIPAASWARGRSEEELVLLCVGHAAWVTRGTRKYLLLSERAQPPPVFALWTINPRQGLELPDPEGYTLESPPRKISNEVAYQKVSNDPAIYAKLLVAVSDARACRDLLKHGAPLQLYCLRSCRLFPLRAEFLHDPPRFLLTGDAAVADALMALKQELSRLGPLCPPICSTLSTTPVPPITPDAPELNAPGLSYIPNPTLTSGTVDHNIPDLNTPGTSTPNHSLAPDAANYVTLDLDTPGSSYTLSLTPDTAIPALVSSRPSTLTSADHHGSSTDTAPSRHPSPTSADCPGSSTDTAPSRPSTPSTLTAHTPDISPPLSSRSSRSPSPTSRLSASLPPLNRDTRTCLESHEREVSPARSGAAAAPCARWAAAEASFVAAHRLPKQRARALVHELRPLLPRTEPGDVGPDEKVLICLSFLASGRNPASVSECAAIAQVVEALNQDQIFKTYVRFPETPKERADIKYGFYEQFGLPGVVGAMGGVHVPVMEPDRGEHDCFNGVFHSLNVQIICDADQKILSVDTSHGGAAHSCAVWLQHQLNYHLKFLRRKMGEKVCVLGDAGYPPLESLLTPIDAPATHAERRYNAALGRARSVVGRCIDALLARWRCLSTASETTAPTQALAASIVCACAVLHNIAKDGPLPADKEFSRSERRVAADVEAKQGTAARYLAARGVRPGTRALERGLAIRRDVARQLQQRARARTPTRPDPPASAESAPAELAPAESAPAKSVPAKSAPAKSAPVKLATTKSATTKAATTKSATTNSATTKSATTKSATTKSVPAKSTLTKSALTKSALTKSALAKLAPAKSALTKSAPAKSGPAKSPPTKLAPIVSAPAPDLRSLVARLRRGRVQRAQLVQQAKDDTALDNDE